MHAEVDYYSGGGSLLSIVAGPPLFRTFNAGALLFYGQPFQNMLHTPYYLRNMTISVISLHAVSRI